MKSPTVCFNHLTLLRTKRHLPSSKKNLKFPSRPPAAPSPPPSSTNSSFPSTKLVGASKTYALDSVFKASSAAAKFDVWV